MFRLAVILWALIGTTLAGIFILAVVAVPTLADQAMRFIPWAAAAGVILAVPLSAVIARAIIGGPRSLA
jgi:hypothetical protein